MALPRTVLGPLAVAALLLAACGDDAATDAATTTSPAADDVDTPEPDEVETDTDDAADDTDDDVDDDMDGDMPDGPSDDTLVGAYCALSAQAEARSASFAGAEASAAEVEEFYRGMLALTNQGLETVPPEVADALTVQRDVLVETIEILETAGWDLGSAIDDLVPIYERPGFLQADEALEDFDVVVCGFAPSDDRVEGPPPPESPPEVPDEFVAYCDASFEASQEDALPFGAGPAELQAYYGGLLARIDELLVLGPDELQGALTTIRSNFVEVIAILESVDWDIDAGLAQIEEWAADAAVAEPMEAALEQVEAFDADVCGIVF